jgi:hypothetical protein
MHKSTKYTNISRCRDTYLEKMHYGLILPVRTDLKISLTVWVARFDETKLLTISTITDIRCQFKLR